VEIPLKEEEILIKRKRFSEEQSIRITSESDRAALFIQEICRENGIKHQTFTVGLRKYAANRKPLPPTTCNALTAV
jgi:transposase-like protein